MDEANSHAVPDKGPHIMRVDIAMTVIPIVSLLLRFWSKTVTQKFGYALDDWLALCAGIMAVTINILSLEWVKRGLGRPVTTVPPPDLEEGLKILFAGEIVYNLGVGFVKLSALAFYGTIFGHHITFRRVLMVSGAVCIAWFVAFIPISIWTCQPVEKFWRPATPGKCMDNSVLYMANSIIDTSLDLGILLLPLPSIWKLHVDRQRKLLITLAFVCGYCALVTSIGRLHAIITAGKGMQLDPTYTGSDVMVWCSAEPAICVFSICVPSFLNLFKRAKRSGVSALFNTSKCSQPRSTAEESYRERSFDIRRFTRINDGGVAHAFVSGGGPLVEQGKQGYAGHELFNPGPHGNSPPNSLNTGHRDDDMRMQDILMRRDVLVEPEHRV